MKTIQESMRSNKFEWEYVRETNKINDVLNSFTEGKKEAINHATVIITDLMMRISMLEEELKSKG